MECGLKIGNFTVEEVHPDMVRIYNEETAEAVTLKEWEFLVALDRILEEAGVSKVN